MRAIGVGTRVSARRGPLLAVQEGQKRAQRARKYGTVTEAVWQQEWSVLWDDGVVTREKTKQIRQEASAAGLPVVVNVPNAVGSTLLPMQSTPTASPASPAAAAGGNPPSEMHPSTQPQDGIRAHGTSPDSSPQRTDVPPNAPLNMQQANPSITPMPQPPVQLAVQSAGSAAATGCATTAVSEESQDCMLTADRAEEEEEDGEPGQSDSSDDEDPDADPVSAPDAHAEARRQAAAALAALVGQTVPVKDSKKKILTWTVVEQITDSTVADRQSKLPQQAALKDGLPTARGEVDLLALWMLFYPGDMLADLHRLNEQALLRKTAFKPVSQREWVVFWGCVLAARQFNRRGADLWEGQHPFLASLQRQSEFSK